MRPPRRFVESRIDRFLSDPASPRSAIWIMVSLTVLTVLVGSLVIWLLDPEVDFPDFATALWFTLQTVTTVGYGDVTPVTTVGRVIAGIVMIVALAFLTIVTALVTSTFVEAAQSRRRKAETAVESDATDRLHARLDEIFGRLAALEDRIATAKPRDDGDPKEMDDRTDPVGP
jgi:voltage-gated potassium channel